MTESSNKYKFLSNKPLGDDLFESRSQNKIADVICNEIIDKDDFKVIGIDGEWGSGKSNLIKLLQKKLSKNYVFFIYDVWGHQEDSQRQAILIKLTEFVREQRIIKNQDKWQSKLNDLLAKRKFIETKSTPNFNVGFIIFLLVTIMYGPVIISIGNKIEDMFLRWTLFLIPIITIVLIYLSLLFINIVKICFRGFKSKENILKKTFKQASQIYTDKKSEEVKREIVSEKEPTVEEFQTWMKELDNDLKSNSKKVIIVFDNFDRLPKKHIISLWSYVHIFFAEKHYENIKVFLPFDKKHIQAAFNDLNDNIESNSKSNFAADYINKTFDVVFRVTPSIMSDWKSYFRQQYKTAIPNSDERELNLVIQVYEFLNRRITPREMISFINEILTIKILNEEYKERYIGIFVLMKDEILENPLKAITELDYLKGLKLLYQNDKEFPKQLTAIIYNLEVDDALELIYTHELKHSLNNNDIDRFNSICKTDFIEAIFSRVISELETVENPILTLSKIEEDSNLPQMYIVQAWEKFYNKVILEKKEVNELKIEDWQIVLIQNSKDDIYLSSLLKDYSNLLNDNNLLKYTSVIDRLIEGISYKGIEPLLKRKNIPPIELVKLVENKGEDYKQYKLFTKPNQLDDYLKGLEFVMAMKIGNLKYLIKDFPLLGYKKSLKSHFVNVIKARNIDGANDCLLQLKETIRHNGELKNILDAPQIYSLWIKKIPQNLPLYYDVLAMRIAKGIDFPNNYIPQFTGILNVENIELSKKVSETLLNYMTFSDMLLLAPNFLPKFFKEVMIHILNNDEIERDGDVLKVIKSYGKIKKAIDDNSNLLFNNLEKCNVDFNKISMKETDEEFAKDCFKLINSDLSQKFIKEFNSEFKGLGSVEYEMIFSNSNEIHYKFFEKLDSESLTQTSLDAFQKQMILNIKNERIDNLFWSIFKIYESNDSRISIKNLLKDIRDEFLASRLNLKVDFAIKILPYFFKYSLLDGKNDIFRKIIKSKFLNEEGFIDLLNLNGDIVKNLYKHADQEDKKGFRNTINEKREENEKIDKLAKLIDIRRDSKESNK